MLLYPRFIFICTLDFLKLNMMTYVYFFCKKYWKKYSNKKTLSQNLKEKDDENK